MAAANKESIDEDDVDLARSSDDSLLRFTRSRDDIRAEPELGRGISGNVTIKVRLKGKHAEMVEMEHEDLDEFKGAPA